MVRMKLDPIDEYTHTVDTAKNFNESMYFNFYDPSVALGGFVRLGNRPNEGYAEQTTCIYLPDGRVAFMFQRPEIMSNDAFDAGGCRFDVRTPFEDIGVAYEGKAVLLAEPMQMSDPKRAFKENPWTDVSLRLDYRGLSPMYGGEPVNDDGSPLGDMSGGFAKAHYEQHVGARGTLTVDGADWQIDGWGLRDHSWGPRSWQAPWWYRWLTCNVGEDFGFMLSIVASKSGSRRTSGIVYADGEYFTAYDGRIETEWGEPGTIHRGIRAWIRTANAEYEMTGEVLNLIPLRNRRTTPEGDELVTRISEGMTEWKVAGVGTGHGLSEYLDQIIDGRPVGAAEE